jgi:hypothetical protein
MVQKVAFYDLGVGVTARPALFPDPDFVDL